MPDDDDLDLLYPGYNGAKGRYCLHSIFGDGFCYQMMADFDLPTCHDEIDWDDSKSRARWLHFYVAFIPVYLEDGAQMVKEQPEHAEVRSRTEMSRTKTAVMNGVSAGFSGATLNMSKC